MVNMPPRGVRKTSRFGLARLGRDYAYVLPGLFISLFAFLVLVPMTVASIGTFVIWIGVLLLPVTLRIASGFAQVSRARLRSWGVHLPAAPYEPFRPGIMGFIRPMADPRRWLDLVFETVVAFPLRLFTFVVAVAWTAGAIGGITYWFWGIFVPDGDVGLTGLILEAFREGPAPDAASRDFLVEAGFQFVVGLLLLMTLPLVMRGLALLDAVATSAALGRRADSAEGAREDTAVGEPDARSGPFPGLAQSHPGEGWAWIVASFAAVVTIAVSWPVLAVLYGLPGSFAMCLALGSAVALILVVRWPYAGVGVQTITAVATTLLTAGSSGLSWLPWPWPVMSLIIHAIIVALVALRHSWPQAIMAWAVPLAGVQLTSFLATATSADLDPELRSSEIVSPAVTVGVLVAGLAVRQMIRNKGALREERRTSAQLSAKRQELEERNRIARELHDVVAHSMSVIGVQATTAKYRLPDMAPEVESEFESVAGSSRQALTEMRSLLALLRSTEEGRGAPLVPQPTLADIPALVEATRQSGARIGLRWTPRDDNGDPTWDTDDIAVPVATGLTAYRIVQEALSNAVRHAPGSEVAVGVGVTDSGIRIDVVNGPPQDSVGRPTAAGAGLGLRGLRERVGTLGGTFDASPTAEDAGGGFRVRAELPL